MIANVVVENPKLIYKNFSGEVTPYNTKGMRNFCVILEDALIDVLTQDGWNVRYLKNYKEDALIPYLKVSINYKYFNKPEITVMSSAGKIMLEEEQIGMLDKMEIKNSKLIIRSHMFNNYINKTSGTSTDGEKRTSGVLAYLKSFELFDVFVSDSFIKTAKVAENETFDVSLKDALNISTSETD